MSIKQDRTDTSDTSNVPLTGHAALTRQRFHPYANPSQPYPSQPYQPQPYQPQPYQPQPYQPYQPQPYQPQPFQPQPLLQHSLPQVSDAIQQYHKTKSAWTQGVGSNPSKVQAMVPFKAQPVCFQDPNAPALLGDIAYSETKNAQSFQMLGESVKEMQQVTKQLFKKNGLTPPEFRYQGGKDNFLPKKTVELRVLPGAFQHENALVLNKYQELYADLVKDGMDALYARRMAESGALDFADELAEAAIAPPAPPAAPPAPPATPFNELMWNTITAFAVTDAEKLKWATDLKQTTASGRIKQNADRTFVRNNSTWGLVYYLKKVSKGNPFIDVTRDTQDKFDEFKEAHGFDTDPDWDGSHP